AWPAAKIGSIRNDADPHEDFLEQCRYTPWTSTWNILGAPSISLPVHSADVDGVELPFGVMLGARSGQEELLLSLVADLEDVDPWANRIAPIARWPIRRRQNAAPPVARASRRTAPHLLGR